MEPRFVDREAFTVMGVMIHSAPDKVDFGAFWEKEFMPHHKVLRALSLDGCYYGVWFADEGDDIPFYLAGMAVPDDAAVPKGLLIRRLLAEHYAVFDCTMEAIGATYAYAYNTWMPASPYEMPQGTSDFEFYPPEGVADVSPAIYIPIRHKSV